MLKYCGAAIIALIAIIILRGQRSEFAPIVSLSAAVILFTAAAVGIVPVLSELRGFIDGTGFEKYLSTLVKALGITLAVQFSAELCRDAGESAIASKLELIGKVEMIVLALPLIRELIGLAGGLME